MPAVFNAYGRYYDLLYRDKDYAAEAGYVRELMARHGVRSGELLEFGSGTGKHARLLAEAGFRVHGIERSAEMAARAEASPGFTCEQGDICSVRTGRTYDAVLSLFHVVSYQVSNAELLAVFQSAAIHLKVGGLFVFDFWYSPAVHAQQPAVRVKRMADEEVEITRIAEPVLHPNENRVDVNYTVISVPRATGIAQTFTETHPMRHFSLPEIDLLAQGAGFERVGAEEFLTGGAVGPQSWGVCVTLRKTHG